MRLAMRTLIDVSLFVHTRCAWHGKQYFTSATIVVAQSDRSSVLPPLSVSLSLFLVSLRFSFSLSFFSSSSRYHRRSFFARSFLFLACGFLCRCLSFSCLGQKLGFVSPMRRQIYSLLTATCMYTRANVRELDSSNLLVERIRTPTISTNTRFNVWLTLIFLIRLQTVLNNCFSYLIVSLFSLSFSLFS